VGIVPGAKNAKRIAPATVAGAILFIQFFGNFVGVTEILLGCGFVHALDGVVYKSAKSQQDFLTRLLAMFPELWGEDTFEGFAHFCASGADMFAHIFREVMSGFLLLGRLFSHKLSLLV
jgi:hypothetical protein